MHCLTDSAVKNQYLLYYGKIFLKCVGEISFKLLESEVREEEEFFPLSYGLNLLQDENSQDLIEKVSNLESQLKEIIKSNEQQSTIAKALYTRLHFKKLYYQIHLHLGDRTLKGISRAKKLILNAMKEFDNLVKQHYDLKIPEKAPFAFDPMLTRRVSSPAPLKPLELRSFEQV